MINRRCFLHNASLTALLGAAGCVSKRAVPYFFSGAPDLKFGVLSDVHLKNPGDEVTLVKAFEYFRDSKVDGVMIAGDIADTGRISEFKRCIDAFNRVFPGGNRPDGEKVEKLFIYGNHDIYGWSWIKKNNPEEAMRDGIGYEDSRPAKIWEEIVGEPYSDFWIKNVKGFTFIGGHWTKSDQFNGLGAFLKAHEKEIDPSKPFFYTQHSHPKNTCIGPWAWGHDNGISTQALSAYPNAVAFSGHSHYPLTDERSVWQGTFTSINTASLRYCSFDYSLRENIDGTSYGFNGEKRKHLMSRVNTGDSRHGMIVSVYGHELVIERRDFLAGTSLGDDWVISVPVEGDNSFAARAAKRTPPQFTPGSVPSVRLDGKFIHINFPGAKSVNKCRAFEYEVTATLVEDEVDLVQVQRRVMARDFHKPETPSGVPGSCVLSLDEIPIKGNTVFSVRPVDCFGLKGEPIYICFNTNC
jgi:predicted phosphodiesterase